ncbi:protein-disulfide reductase DsbD family protein [Cerasicoccus fimbriatus]|uniref:protein-disulfide reductase DsbD family protein n=1 Tax=Cerasicoccus fimbriatus TaxID=3014554 RepID=UPI0022B3A298|nr:protein-disulfide reductase DsbD domain-containing protein [Cerasicoccus sp. TK19100]
MKRFLRIFALWLTAVAALTAAPQRSQHVEAELVADVTSAQPGEPFWVALRMKMDPHWHTYWVNPGDAGIKTTIEWQDLPEGVTIGDIHWPTPKVFDQAGIMNYVYEDEVFLMMQATVEEGASLSELKLKARADWLECDDQMCVPGGVDLTLDLPVSTESPEASEWSNDLKETREENWPQTLSDAWAASASQSGDQITLTLTPLASAQGHNPGELTFFAVNSYIEPAAEQILTRSDDGILTVVMTKNEFYDGGEPDSLPGVVRAANGWLPDGKVIGLSVDPTLTTATNTAATSGAASGAPTTSDPIIDTPDEGGSWVALIPLAFIGGMILNLMPCVFPVIGLKVMGFVSQAGESHRKVIVHGLVYTLGVLVSFWAIGLLFEPIHQTFVSSGEIEGGWASWLTPKFVTFLIILVFVFSLSLSGLFEIGVSAVGLGSSWSSKAGLVGTFFSGLFAVAVGAPCAAPFLAPVLGALVKTNFLQREILLTVIGLGLAFPYLLFSFFPQLTRKLPRPGAWMETFKQGMAFLLYATVAALVWVLADQVEAYTLLTVLFGLVLAAMGCWVYGRWGTLLKSKGVRTTATIVALALIIGPMAFAFAKISENERREALIAEAKESGAQLDFLVWEKWSPEAVQTLLAQGRPVYIDFTARWCATCQVNKRVYNDVDLVREFQKDNVATLNADWTDHNPEIAKALAEFDRSAVPFNILYIPGREKPVILPELLTDSNVRAALAEIGNESV